MFGVCAPYVILFSLYATLFAVVFLRVFFSVGTTTHSFEGFECLNLKGGLPVGTSPRSSMDTHFSLNKTNKSYMLGLAGRERVAFFCSMLMLIIIAMPCFLVLGYMLFVLL